MLIDSKSANTSSKLIVSISSSGSHIRQVDAICHVVRCFDDDNITHVEGRVDPLEDIDTINLELVLADLESIPSLLTLVPS